MLAKRPWGGAVAASFNASSKLKAYLNGSVRSRVACALLKGPAYDMVSPVTNVLR